MTHNGYAMLVRKKQKQKKPPYFFFAFQASEILALPATTV